MKYHLTRRQLIHGLSILMIVAVLLFLAVMTRAYFDGRFQSVESFQEYVGGYGIFGPVFLTAFQVLQVIIPAVPGLFGCAVGSIMYGPLVGFLCNYIGISAGSVIAFLLGRKYGMPLLKDLFPEGRYRRWADWASHSRSYTAFLFLAMLLPLFPDDYFCYLTGVSEMSLRKFSWIIILGKPWCILAYCLGFSLIN